MSLGEVRKAVVAAAGAAGSVYTALATRNLPLWAKLSAVVVAGAVVGGITYLVPNTAT